MNKFALVTALALGWSAAPGPAAEEPKIERKPLAIGAMHEFGQIHKGIYAVGSTGRNSEITENDWIDHFAASMTQSAVINERLFLSGGLGGIFEFRKPELVGGRVNAGFAGAQRKAFFVGPSQVEAVYHFGDPAKPWLKIGSGMFGYKYNPNAYNLGEYLFRSGAYPTYTVTGGYALVGSAGAGLQGFKSNLDLGAFKADMFLVTETGLAPFFDWSLAAVASYTVGDGLFEIGAGVNFKRLLKVKPSRTARERPGNGYFTGPDGNTYAGYLDYYNNPAQFYLKRGFLRDSLANAYATDADASNDALVPGLRSQADSDSGIGLVWDNKSKLVDGWQQDSSTFKPSYTYYSAAATLLMGRASFDVKKLFDGDAFGPEDLKLYGEVAVLGLKNDPLFYKKTTERMPMMAGFNFPGFKILDLIAIQAEYMNSPWLNNTYQVGQNGFNVPTFPSGGDPLLSGDQYNDLTTKDNFKWSVLLQKKLGTNITLSGQVASDHLRMTSSYFYYGPQFDHNEVTAGDDHWYWMTQLSWGI